MSKARLKVAIVTSSRKSYASLLLKQRDVIDAELIVVVNKPNPIKNRKVIKKIKKIGLLGSILGILFRSTYQFEFEDVESLCKFYKVPILYVNNFKLGPEEKKQISELDIGISMGNGYIPSTFFSLFKYGMINIHHEILPDYPGAQSIIWPIIEGNSKTGFSIHKINKGIDKGELIFVQKRNIRFFSNLMKTTRENYFLSLKQSVEVLTDLLKTSPFEWNTVPNNSAKSYTTPTLTQWIRAFTNHRKLKKSAI